jgi:hypothetical protein
MTVAYLSCETEAACQQLAAVQESIVLQAVAITVTLVVLYKLIWFACFGPQV